MILVFTHQEDTEGFAQLVLRRAMAVGEGAEEVLGELANTIAARLRAAFADRDFHLRIGIPETSTTPDPDHDEIEWTASLGFATSHSQRFLVRVAAVELEVQHDIGAPGLTAATSGDPAPGTSPTPGDAGSGGDELADVLF